MPKKKKKDRPIFKGRSHKSFLNQCRLKLVTLGYKWSIKILINELKKNSITKKVTITGGEPLFQLKALETLVDELYKEQFNIVLYTGHRKEDVPKDILSKINYLKYGPFIYSKRTSTIPFVGSSNQVFEKLR